MVLLSGCLLLYRQHQYQVAKRQELVKGVLAIANVPTLPNPEVLENFRAVRELGQTPPDEELLALLQ